MRPTSATRRSHQAAADARPACRPTSPSTPTAPSPPISARWTWARACSSPSARSSPKNSTCRSRPSRSSWATPRPASIRAAPPARPASRTAASRCAWPPPKRAACWSRWRPRSSALPADQLDGHRRRRAAPPAMPRKKVSYAELIGGSYFNVQLDWNKQIRQSALRARQGQAEGPEGPQDRRPADQARGHRAEGVRAGGLLHRHQGARHGAWPHDPSGDRRRGAGEGRRKLDQGHPGRQGGLGQGLPRRRRRQGVGRHQGGAAAQGRMVERSAAVPRSGGALRSHPQGAGAQARRSKQADRQRRRRRSRPPRA